MMLIPFGTYAKSVDETIKNAIEKVRTVKAWVDEITQELFELDDMERIKNPQLDEQYRIVRNEIVKVITSIGETTEQISNAVKRLSLYQNQIKEALENLKVAKESSTLAKEYYIEYVNLLHKIDLELYDPQGEEINEIRLLLNTDNINKTFITENIINSMAQQLESIIDQADTEQTKKVALLSKLGTLKQEARKILNTYYEEIEKLEQKKQYLVHFLEMYKSKQQDIQIRFQKVFASRKEVNTSILAFLDEIVKKNYTSYSNISEKIEKLEELPDANTEETALVAWPIYPIEEITRYFWDKKFEETYNFKFKSLQIKALQWTPVHATRDGVVYHVVNSEESISRVMIVHQNGYVSVYQFLNSIIVEPWDIVQRGQIIGYSWGEPWTKWAWYVSEGENLTFSIYKDWVAIDPLTILDLSVVTDWKDTLPQDYKLKYLSDVMTRPIDVSDIKIMSGDTVDERSQNFISLYAKGVYRDLKFWDQVVEGTNIDRDMVICVAFAESTLGHYLATANNIGNVGNNDRGDRIAYATPYQGARLIAETLNNPFLGDYHTIKQLSRYGNKDGAIYASSPINWQTNVLKCLSKIKGYTIPEDFPFRTGPNPNK